MAESPAGKEQAAEPSPTETQAARHRSLDESYLAALKGRDESVQAAARWFRCDHLPQEALHSDVAREFQAFAFRLLEMVSDDSLELTIALRKLLEAKDEAVRAAMS